MTNRFNLLTINQANKIKQSLLVMGSLILSAGSSVAIADDLAPSNITLETSCAGLSWSEPDANTVSINIHDNNGAYITTVGVDETPFLPSGSGNYFIVETNTGPWQTWLTTEQVFYSTESNNGQECENQIAPLTVSSENGYLVWEPNEFIDQARTFRPTVNIHAADGSYISTTLAENGRWPATESGSYFFVAVVGPNRDVSDWRTWRSSDIVQVNVADNGNDSEITTENFQTQLGETLDRWRAVQIAPFRNALTTALQQWFPILPDISTNNGFDSGALTLGEREAQCDSGSVVADIVDFAHNINDEIFGRLQIELDFSQCVWNTVTHNGQATIFLGRGYSGRTDLDDNDVDIFIREILHWRDFEITSNGQFVQRFTGSEQLRASQFGELRAFGKDRTFEEYSESTNGVLDFNQVSFNFNNFEANPFAIENGPDSFTAEVTFREGGTMDIEQSGRRQTLTANFVLRPDRDVGFHYSTNPSNLQDIPFDQIELTESLEHVGITITNQNSGNSLRLRPGSSGGDTVNYTITSQTDATTVEQDFLYPIACDSRGLFSSLDVCL